MEETTDGTGMTTEDLWSVYEEMLSDYCPSWKQSSNETKQCETQDVQVTPPPAPEQKKNRKRLRQSPATAPYIPLPLCEQCNGANVIDDVPQGQTVCTDCGLVQSATMIMMDAEHCSYDQLKQGNRVYIHRYSRVVHFVAVIRSLQGQTVPRGLDSVVTSLRARLGGRIPRVCDIHVMLKDMKLSGKFGRHAVTLCVRLGGEPVINVISDEVLMLLCRKFRIYEYWYEKGKNVIWSTPRKVFFSYPFIVYRFLCDIGVDPPRSLLLKCKTRQQQQFDAFDALTRFIEQNDM